MTEIFLAGVIFGVGLVLIGIGFDGWLRDIASRDWE